MEVKTVILENVHATCLSWLNVSFCCRPKLSNVVQFGQLVTLA